MKKILINSFLFAVVATFAGCAMMSDEDRDFYGRGWVNPRELDRPMPHHSVTAPGADSAPLPAGDPTHDPAWDVPGAPPQ